MGGLYRIGSLFYILMQRINLPFTVRVEYYSDGKLGNLSNVVFGNRYKIVLGLNYASCVCVYIESKSLVLLATNNRPEMSSFLSIYHVTATHESILNVD